MAYMIILNTLGRRLRTNLHPQIATVTIFSLLKLSHSKQSILPPIERNKYLFLILFREKKLFVMDEKQQHQISKNLIFLEKISFYQKELKMTTTI